MIPSQAVVVSLDRLADDPARATALSFEAATALLARSSVAQGALIARLLAVQPQAQRHDQDGRQQRDQLLTAVEAAALLGVTPRWLYRHARRLPFARRLSRKVLRFSQVGVHRYLETRRG